MTYKGMLVKRERSPYWYMLVKINGVQKWKSTGTRNKKEAEKMLADFCAPYNAADKVSALRAAAEQVAERQGERVAAGMSLADAWEYFEDSPERPDSGPATLANYRRQWNQFCAWAADRYPKLAGVSGVTPEIAALYARELGRSVSASTYNKHRNLLRLVWKVLARRLKHLENPWEGIPPKRMMPVSRRELTTDELQRLIATATGEMKTLFALGIYTGLRLGDCCTLQWEEIDFGLGVIRRIPNKTKRKTRQVVSIPIHPTLMEILTTAKGKRENGAVLCEFDRMYRKERGAVCKKIRTLFDTCGIRRTGDCETPGKNTRNPVLAGFHSLRHTFVSICRTSGVPLAFVEAIVGHANPAMTRHYTHIGDEAARAAVSLLPDLSSGATIAPLPPALPDSLSDWVKDQMTGMNSRNWRAVRDAVLARCVTHQNNEP